MKLEFVKIVNNDLIHNTNIVIINKAVSLNKITQTQSKLLLSNNNK